MFIFTIPGFFLQKHLEKNNSSYVQPLNVSFSPAPQVQHEKTALFVPFWTIDKTIFDKENYSALIYSGVIANENGIDTTGQTYSKLTDFLLQSDQNKKKLLTIQMTNALVNTRVLQNISLQQKIIDQSLILAKENNFNGIVLDFEFSALPFASITESITNFITRFSQKTHKSNVSFAITLYGDVFYRPRPYNVALLAKQADEVMVMAYDFHKAKGDPGANFPLTATKDEDYDFTIMVDDFLKKVPKEKLTIIFGMYGYDWKTGERGQSIMPATSLSLNQIKQKFLMSCKFTTCKITRDSLSTETKITYTDNENTNHVVWFEDEESVKKKKIFIETKGIFSTGMWAYSYF
ncbi:MAG: hypothetical protein E6H08_21960 [Bacteroidetes bacterium]|nr:MAG: hypothetical protein E6H08_21960 [Bacteroidota bacterium]